MSDRDEFEESCAKVCADRGWTHTRGRIEIPCPGDRSQAVEYEFFEFEDQELVRLSSRIGSRKRVVAARLATALDLNFRLPHGAFAIHRDDLVLVDTMLAGEADAAEIAACVHYLAETADHYESTMFGLDEN